MSSAPLQELTRKLQEERDALRTEVDTLVAQAQEMRVARSNIEDELQVKELELLHIQQRSNQTIQQLRDKLVALENELDDERAVHKMTLMACNVATQKNTAMSAEIKELELKWKKEMEKKELLMAELELVQDETRALVVDRDHLIHRTEEDARRVRELWQQIAIEHETQIYSLRTEYDAAQESRADLERKSDEWQRQIQDLEATVKALREDKTSLEDRLMSVTADQTRINERLELDRQREQHSSDKHQQLVREAHDKESKWRMAAQREEIAVREQKLAAAELERCRSELEDTREQLLLIKTEFSDLLDKHERASEEFKQQMRHRDAQAALRSKKLADGKRCAEELAAIRKKEIIEYKKVMYSVNRKLNEVKEHQEAAQLNAWPVEGQTQKSLCIYRH